VNEWEREFDQFEKDGNLPNLEFVRVMNDHTGSFSSSIDGVNTPELDTADNDYGGGRIVEKVAKSKSYSGIRWYLWSKTTPGWTGPRDAHRQHCVYCRTVRESKAR